MSVGRVVGVVCLLSAVACGGSGREDVSGTRSESREALSTSSSSSKSERAASSPDASRTSATSTTRTAPAVTNASPTAPTPSEKAKGLIHGNVERDCSSNPGAGGGCYNQGGAVAGTVVELRSTGGQVLMRATTASDGTFEFSVEAGRYVIRHASSGVSQERDVTAGRTTFVSLVVP